MGVEAGAEAGPEASLLGKTRTRGCCDCGPAPGSLRARLGEMGPRTQALHLPLPPTPPPTLTPTPTPYAYPYP